MRRDSGGVSVAVVRRSDRSGEREAGLPSCALSIIHDPTLRRAGRAEVTGRDKGGMGWKWCFWIFGLMERGTNENRETYTFFYLCVCACTCDILLSEIHSLNSMSLTPNK